MSVGQRSKPDGHVGARWDGRGYGLKSCLRLVRCPDLTLGVQRVGDELRSTPGSQVESSFVRDALTSRPFLLGLAATGLGVWCEWLQPGVFTSLLGSLPAWAVLGGCTLASSVLAPFARAGEAHTGLFDRALPTRLLLGWTALFAFSITLIDLAAPFPADIHVRLPYALLFYPAIAYVAETVFHVVPLSAVMQLTKRTAGRPGGALVSQAGVVAVTLIEPIFQASFAAPGRPLWAEALTFAHIAAINALLVSLVAQRGPFAAYVQRVAYYGYWHVLYGELRLYWLA